MLVLECRIREADKIYLLNMLFQVTDHRYRIDSFTFGISYCYYAVLKIKIIPGNFKHFRGTVCTEVKQLDEIITGFVYFCTLFFTPGLFIKGRGQSRDEASGISRGPADTRKLF